MKIRFFFFPEINISVYPSNYKSIHLDLTITVLALIMFMPLALCGEDESIQLTAQKIPLLFQVLDALLQP